MNPTTDDERRIAMDTTTEADDALPTQRSTTRKFKNNLLQRLGGESEYEMIVSCYIDNIVEDEELKERFQLDPKSLAEQQRKALDVILAEDPEHAEIRVAIYYKELLDQGFRREHYKKFRDHFIMALRETWEDEGTIKDVKDCFKEYEEVFDKRHSSSSKDPHAKHHHSIQEKNESSASASTKRKKESSKHTTDTLLSPNPTEKKKSITSALQKTPAQIRALKDKIAHHLSPRSRKNTTAAVPEDKMKDLMAPPDL